MKENVFNFQIQKGVNEMNEPIFAEDAVNTLMYTIMRHFVGNNQLIVSRTCEQLSNLKCKSLFEFKFYWDTSFSKVFARNDCNSDYWKVKFVVGLPILFSQRVKTRLKNKNGVIPWDEYTYGELASEVIAEGEDLCNILKIQKQLSEERARGKWDLRDFC